LGGHFEAASMPDKTPGASSLTILALEGERIGVLDDRPEACQQGQ
jgi:hypothetical protein